MKTKAAVQFLSVLCFLAACARDPVPTSIANGKWVSYSHYSQYGKPNDEFQTPIPETESCFYLIENETLSVLSSVGHLVSRNTVAWEKSTFEWDGDFLADKMKLNEDATGYSQKNVRLGDDDQTLHFDTQVRGCPGENIHAGAVSLRRVNETEALRIQEIGKADVERNLLEATGKDTFASAFKHGQTVIFTKDLPLDSKREFGEYTRWFVFFVIPMGTDWQDYIQPYADLSNGDVKILGPAKEKNEFKPLVIPKGLKAQVTGTSDGVTLTSKVPGFEQIVINVAPSMSADEFREELDLFTVHKAGYYDYLTDP